MKFEKAQNLLKKWYLENKRTLPWRESRDPYLIWISEVMLQQTTVQAVIPFFNKFKKKFPNVKALAESPIENVLESWAGLGYYSRARNLHKASKAIVQQGTFPKSYIDLIKLPGFGDYTSRAVSSIAFGESVGVVDGNVIRILSRLTGKAFIWWKSEEKKEIQKLSDSLCKNEDASVLNQAMMELGATVCTPTSPACLLCPWGRICEAKLQNRIDELPIKRVQKSKVILLVEMDMHLKDEKIILTTNEKLPFLKGTKLPPSKVETLKSKPSNFHFKHSITHYQIYVVLKKCENVKEKTNFKNNKASDWYSLKDVSKVNPSSLLKKAIYEYSNKRIKI